MGAFGPQGVPRPPEAPVNARRSPRPPRLVETAETPVGAPFRINGEGLQRAAVNYIM
jgi:hypothetical protein